MRRLLPFGWYWLALLLVSGSALLPSAVSAQDATGDAPAAVEPQTGIDWSVGLRGSFANDSLTGQTTTFALTPEASFTLAGQSSKTVWSAGAEGLVGVPGGEGVSRISDLHAGVTHNFALDPDTTLAGSANLSLTQASPTSSGLPATTLIAPLELNAAVEGSVTRKFGRFDLTPSLKLARLVVGDTTLTDHSTVTNTDQNDTLAKGGLRVGYDVTPLVGVFVDGSVTSNKFDAVDPTLLKFLDSHTYELRAGVRYTQTSILATEVSLGRAFLDYTDASLTDAPSWVANGQLTFTPDPTLTLKAALDTTLGPSTTVSGDTDASYTLSGSVAYLVNPWVTLRGTGGVTRTVTLGSGDIAQTNTVGAGFDYASSRHLLWSADYLFQHTDPATGASSDTHTITVGATLKR